MEVVWGPMALASCHVPLKNNHNSYCQTVLAHGFGANIIFYIEILTEKLQVFFPIRCFL